MSALRHQNFHQKSGNYWCTIISEKATKKGTPTRILSPKNFALLPVMAVQNGKWVETRADPAIVFKNP